MKILHIIFSLNVGGTENMLVDILNEQVKTNNKVELIIINDEFNNELLNKIDKRVKISFCNRKKGSKNIYPIILLNYKIFKLKPDIIHAHEYTTIQSIFLKKKWKTLLTVHAIGLETKYLPDFDTVCAISTAVQKDIYNRSKLDCVELIYNGISFDKIDHKRREVENKSFKIVQISRLDHEKKGQDVLIKALSLLNGEHNITIDFIGEGASMQYLKNLTSELGVNKHVDFLGLKDRSYVYQHLNQYDLLVQPSIIEGFGLTVTEGMAARIPVLVSNNDGPMEIIAKGKYGFYFEKGNAEDCAEKIMEIMNLKSTDELTEKAYIYAYKNFNIKNTAQKYIDLYKKTLSSTNN